MATFTLGDLHGVCAKLEAVYADNMIAKPKNDTWREAAIEAIRNLSEVVLYCDAQTEEAFELFAENNILELLVAFATSADPNLRIQIQTIQTISILIQNVRRPTSLYLLLSSNYINALLEHSWLYLGEEEEANAQKVEREELEANFVSLLKTLSLRLNETTVHFFVTSDDDRFSLFDAALAYVGSAESMTRTSALATLLNIYRVDEAHVRNYVLNSPKAKTFVDKFCSLLRGTFEAVDDDLQSAETSLASIHCAERVDTGLSLMTDLLFYAQDVLNGPQVFEELWSPSLLDFLRRLVSEAAAAEALSAAAWYVVSLYFRAISHPRVFDAGVAIVVGQEARCALLAAIVGEDEANAACALLALDAVNFGHSIVTALAAQHLDKDSTSLLPGLGRSLGESLLLRRRCVGWTRLAAASLRSLRELDPSLKESTTEFAARALSAAAVKLLEETDLRDVFDEELKAHREEKTRSLAAELSTRTFIVHRDRTVFQSRYSKAHLMDFEPVLEAQPTPRGLIRRFFALRDLVSDGDYDLEREKPEEEVDDDGSMILYGRTCVPCSADADVHAFLVMDSSRLLLAVPDPTCLARGRLLCVAPIAATAATPHDATALEVTVRSATPVGIMRKLPRGGDDDHVPRWGLSLGFDSERNCRIARKKLSEARRASRSARADKLKRHLETFIIGTRRDNNDDGSEGGAGGPRKNNIDPPPRAS